MIEKHKHTPIYLQIIEHVAYALVLFGALVLVVYGLQALRHPYAPFRFPTPVDVCTVDGAPFILSRSTKTKTQTYVDINGDTVMVTYDFDLHAGRWTVDDVTVWYGDGSTCAQAQAGRG